MQNEFVEFLALTSTRRFDHSGGSIAATVSSPSGGKAAFLRTNLSACLKLQNVSGNSGYINSIFNVFVNILTQLRIELMNGI